MAHLLHVDSSALSAGSVSKEIAETFRTTWAAEHPDGTVAYRDLGANPLPALTESAIYAMALPAEQHSPEQAAAFAVRDEVAREVEQADAYLFTVPMYNWGIPGSFKSYLDQIIVVGRTLIDGAPPLAGRPATVILSYGGGYDPGAPKEGWDFVQPYLEKVLGQALGLDLKIIKTQLTLAERVPAMASLIPQAKALRADAHESAQSHARALAAGFSSAAAATEKAAA
jgi:FMN-dependent NADH-azoreductase